MALSEFLNRHAGETAWLFGKGPSLSTFDFKTAGPLRVAINDVIGHVPDCVYGFANDGVRAWRDLYRPDHILFQPNRCLGEFDSTAPGAVACRVVTYDDTRNDIRLALSREDIAELPTIRRGTLGSALQILHVMGVKAVHMVGIDGGGTHAEGFQWRTRLRADHARDYDSIRSAAIDAAFIMGIALRFHNLDHTMETNGKIYVRMLRNCFANFTPYAEGEIASFSPRVANELISQRCAETFIPPAITEAVREEVAPTIETAAAPMPAKESATIKRGRKGK